MLFSLEARQINDMTCTNETFTVTYFQYGGYLMSVRDGGNNLLEVDVVFSHVYHNYKRNNSNELDTDTAHLVDTFLSSPVHTTSGFMSMGIDMVSVNLSSFNGSLEEVRRRNQQAMEAVNAAETFNKILNTQ